MADIHNNETFTVFGKKLKRKWLEYVTFLLIAVVIWYMNALNKDYTADIRFNAEFVDMPSDKALVSAPEDELTLKLHAQGFTLLKYRLGLNLQPLAVSADYASLKGGRRNDGNFYLLGTSLLSDVSSQLGPTVSVLRVMPDTLHFVFSEIVKKQMPVKVMAAFNFEKEFAALGAVRTEPPTVTVAGPRSLVDTIKQILTVNKTYNGLKDSLNAKLKLKTYDGLTVTPDEVHIVLPVERVTEASVTVSIEAVNLPDGYNLKCFPGTVTVNCMAPVSRFDKVQASTFRATVDYNSLQSGTDNKAKVSLSRTPDYAFDIRYHPRSVDYIIEK